MRDAIEAGAFLVIGTGDVPWSPFRIGGLEHEIARALVIKLLTARRQIHGAEFPLAERIGDARLEAAFLFLIADLQPEFDEDDATVHDVMFDVRTALQKNAMLLL